MANIKSQIKRIRTNRKAEERNKAVKSELKTVVRAAREAIEAGLATHFRFTDRSHPLIDELVHLARLRLVRQACGDSDGG